MTVHDNLGSSGTTLEEAKLEVERERLEVEKKKLEVEKMKAHWTAGSILLSALVAVLAYSKPS